MIFKNGTYDKLKTIALILPIFILFYKSIGEIWGIPYTSEVILSLEAVEAVVAGLVKYSNIKYNKMEGNESEFETAIEEIQEEIEEDEE